MRKFLKWTGIFVGIILIFIILVVSSVVIFVDPNRFKPIISERMTQMTGHPITINGDLTWSLFPDIGIKVNHVILGNLAKDRISADIAHVTMSVKLLPLFKQKVESRGISIDGMQLQLIDVPESEKPSQLIPAAAVGIVKVKKSAEQPSHKEPLKIAIDNINITNTSIRWFDEQKKPTMIVKNLELHAKNISLLNPFSITVTFDFANPKIAGNVKLKTMMAANLSSQIYAFKNFDVNIDTDKLPLHVTGDFTADLKRETFQWSPLQGNIDQLHFSGKMSGTEIKAAPKFIGKVNVAPTDLRDLLKKLDYNVQNLQTLNPVSGDFDITFGEKPLTVTGKLKVGTLEFQHITLKNIILPTFYQAGTLTFSPFNADFYQGTMDGTATFALNDQKIGLVLQLQNFAVNELLKDLVAEKSKIKFSGKGFLNVSLKTQGHSTDNKIKNLNGQGKLRIEQGVLQGIDIPNLINSAYAFIKKTPLSSSNTGQTPFNELSGTFTIQNGIVSNQDLKMTATQFSTTGQGNIDLPRNNIHYQLKTIVNKATLQDKDSLLNLYGVAIPILISGDLQNPKIGLDASEVGKILAEMQAKKVEVHIKDKLKGKKASDIINSLFGH